MGTRPGLAKYATLALERSKARSHQEDEATEDAGMSEKKGTCKGIFAKQHPQILKSMHVFWRVAHRNPAACEDKFDHDSKVVYGAHDMVLQMLCAVASKKDTQEILLAQDGEHCVVDMQKMISSGKGFLVWDRTVTWHHFSPLMFDVAGSDPIEVWNMASELGSLVSRQQLMVQNITRNCNLQVPASDKVRQHSLERLQEAGLAHVISRSGTFASWRISAAAMMTKEPLMKLSESKFVRKTAFERANLFNMTLNDVIILLSEEGWKCENSSGVP